MLDDQLCVLSNAHRRRLLLALLEDNPQNDRTVLFGTSETTDDDRKRAVAMGHIHLPKLVDHGYIDWNLEKRSVTKGPQFDELKPLLVALEGMDDDIPGDGSLD
ncbi:DUF7344 domain-containing protein [Haladaptatus sp. DFWS20]|uniref:DUF7344 domain-containing protein n=1 Tax=Haladaptatus sp. DFWS20 TaxID=3403467 RepID=UPI003EBAE2F2